MLPLSFGFSFYSLKNGQKLFTSAALIVIRQRRRRRLKRESREWVQKWLLDRGCYGAVTNLIEI